MAANCVEFRNRGLNIHHHYHRRRRRRRQDRTIIGMSKVYMRTRKLTDTKQAIPRLRDRLMIKFLFQMIDLLSRLTTQYRFTANNHSTSNSSLKHHLWSQIFAFFIVVVIPACLPAISLIVSACSKEMRTHSSKSLRRSQILACTLVT